MVETVSGLMGTHFGKIFLVPDLYSSQSIIRIIKARKMRWAGRIARMGEKRNAYRLLVGKPEGRRSLERPRCRWLDNIRMDLVDGVM
jgi:hypothetical protein